MMTARIAGIGAYVPENLITNDDLAKIVVDSVLAAAESEHFEIRDKDVLAVTEAPPERERAIWRRRRLSGRLRQQELPRKSWISSFSGLRPRIGIIPAMPAVFRRPSGQ